LTGCDQDFVGNGHAKRLQLTIALSGDPGRHTQDQIVRRCRYFRRVDAERHDFHLC
jgi:hypothetical protein